MSAPPPDEHEPEPWALSLVVRVERPAVAPAPSAPPAHTDALVAAARATAGHLITVEDHYPAGGIGDAVAEAVAGAGFTVRRLAVREIPRSGKPEELLDRFGISARHIVDAVRATQLARQ